MTTPVRMCIYSLIAISISVAFHQSPTHSKKINVHTQELFLRRSSILSALQDSEYDELGQLRNIGRKLDDLTNGFALSYANTLPYREWHPFGILFLATNVIYAAVGYMLFANGDISKSLILDLAGSASVLYHWRQIRMGPNQAAVRYALIIDYFTAFVAISSIAIDIFQSVMEGTLSIRAVVLSITAVLSLLGSWYYADGLPYLFFHGLWHIFSGICAAEVAGVHMYNS